MVKDYFKSIDHIALRALFAMAVLVGAVVLFLTMVTDMSGGVGYKLISAFFLLTALAIPFVREPVWAFADKYLKYPVLVLFPALAFYMAETAMNTGYRVMAGSFLFAILNYIIFAFIIWVVYLVTLSERSAVMVCAAFSLLLGIANYFVMLFRQIPLLAGDVSTMGTAMNVAGNYSYVIGMRQYALIMFFFACISFALFAGCKKDVKHSGRFRVSMAILGVAIAAVGYFTAIRTDALAAMGAKVSTYSPIKSYTEAGGMLTFVCSIRAMVIDTPDGYSDSALAEITGGYVSDSVSDGSFMRPNVIVVMNESFADLQSVGDLETLDEVMPFYDSLSENTIKGSVYVSVFGGQTANSEYEFLTGDSKALLPPGATPFQLYIKSYMPTLTGNLLMDGYGSVLAMHPFDPTGYNRNNVYPLLGFEEFIDISYFDADSELIGDRISDSADVAKIIEEYEKNEARTDEPFYMFNVTMQNHSPYTGKWTNLPHEVRLADESYDISGSQDYIDLIHESDAALEELVTYFDGVDEPTVIVFYGDHEPGLSDDFYTAILGQQKDSLSDEESLNLYHTPFLIWANYDIPQEEYRFEDGLSLNYLQSVVLKACGMKQSGYNKYLMELMKDIPIINICGYVGADGNFYETDDKESPYYEEVNNYYMLIYNHLFDINNRMDDFFEYGQ